MNNRAANNALKVEKTQRVLLLTTKRALLSIRACLVVHKSVPLLS